MDSSIIFNLYYDNFGPNNTYLFFFIVNFIFSVIAYKLGFARELPLLKSVLVYIMLGVGVFVITLFSLVKYPITETLIIISVVLAIYRFRLHKDRQAKKEA